MLTYTVNSQNTMSTGCRITRGRCKRQAIDGLGCKFHGCVLYRTGVEIKVSDDWQYEHYSLSDPSNTLPLLYFQAQPCVGKRVVGLHLQIEGETNMSVVITGNTWAFRQRLDAHGVQGGYTEAEGEGQQRTYYHQIAFGGALEDGLLRNTPMGESTQKWGN